MPASAQWQDVYSLIPPQINASGIHLWPFDPTCPVDVRFWSFDRPSTMRANRHEYMEVLYVLSGGLTVEVEQRNVPVTEGALFVMGGNLLHRVTEFHTRGTQAATLYFMPGFICPAGMAGEHGQYLRPFLDQDTQFPHVIDPSTGVSRRAFELMLRIQSEMREQQPGSRLMVRAHLQLILADLFRHYSTSTDISEGRRHALERVRTALEFIDRHHCEHVALQDVSDLVRLSRTQFARIFRQATGQSFIAYLQQRRVEHAKELLASTDKSIAEISQEAGFGNQSYMGVVFRDVVQMSPKEYRHRISRRSDQISIIP